MKPYVILKVLLIIAVTPLYTYAADSEGPSSIESRLDQLERRISALEQGPAKASKQSKTKDTEPASAGWKIKSNWRSLRNGMSDSDVRQLLGEPSKIDNANVLVFWEYPDRGRVTFHGDSMTVYGWKE